MKRFPQSFFLVFLFLVLLASIVSTAPISTVSSASGQNNFNYLFPIFFNTQSIIHVSPSYYVTTLNSSYLNNLGCELGRRDLSLPGGQDSVAVLAFGCPRCLKNGEFGANLFGIAPATINEISTAVKHFAAGYYRCTGTDYSSNLVIGVGTSNYPGGSAPCSSISNAAAHGKAWSNMVRDINNWLKSQGLFHQVQAFGASDIELGWNSPEWSRAWVNGFGQVSGNFLLHFGDAAGCPYDERPSWSCGTSSFPSWTMEDVWYVSYGAPPVLPLPLIYLTTGVHAKQWAYLSQYSATRHGHRMNFTGVFTQWDACQQMGGCNYTDNNPDQAYQQLNRELSKHPATAQFIPWKTDISWILNRSNSIVQSTILPDINEETTHPLQSFAEYDDSKLDSLSLSLPMQITLDKKFSNFQALTQKMDISRLNPADKNNSLSGTLAVTGEEIFEEGLLQRGEIPGRPYGVEINNVWQMQTQEGFAQVAAGSAPDDPQLGAIYLVLTDLNRISFQLEVFLAPQGCGPLEITATTNNLLTLQSIEGCDLSFDIPEKTLKLIEN